MEEKPIDMVLFCPNCGVQHIDAPETEPDKWSMEDPPPPLWTNPPHRSHQCGLCGHVWRPADVPTNGVAAIKTKGKNDSPFTRPQMVYVAPAPLDWSDGGEPWPKPAD